MSSESSSQRRPPLTQLQLKKIQEMASAIRYGSINLVFQDGVLVLIERNEKIKCSSNHIPLS